MVRTGVAQPGTLTVTQSPERCGSQVLPLSRGCWMGENQFTSVVVPAV
ncbi:hypothetical protein ACFVAF_29605 [Streptomyces sp. NPDC057596]